jgi:hypothetical protein
VKKALLSFALFGALIAVSGKSLAVEPKPGQVVFYDDYNCQKPPFLVLDKGSFPDLRTFDLDQPGGATWNDRISCFKIGPGVTVKVFQKINYGGKSKEFGKAAKNPSGMVSLRGDWWDNAIGSVKIF